MLSGFPRRYNRTYLMQREVNSTMNRREVALRFWALAYNRHYSGLARHLLVRRCRLQPYRPIDLPNRGPSGHRVAAISREKDHWHAQRWR